LTLATLGYVKPSLLSLSEVKELLRQFGKVNIMTLATQAVGNTTYSYSM